MKLFDQMALTRDLPEKGLRRGDVATIVEFVTGRGGEQGCVVEIFNALGETVAVVTVESDALEPLSANEVLSVRRLDEPVGTR